VRSNLAVFHLFGFAVHVRSGFFIFMMLVVFSQGAHYGLPLAFFIAVFTLIHELGHAIAARNTGASAEIALDFMAGYAAYVPSRPLTKIERVGISFAGPGVQIFIGGVAYLAIRGGLHWPMAGNAVQIAVFWAGPLIGALNLIPLLPFDGGNILQTVIEVFAPHRARRIMQFLTVAITVGAMLAMTANPSLRRFVFFAVIPLISVLATMSNDRTQTRRAEGQQALGRAEALAWATGDVQFPAGTVPSPWFRAWQQIQQGHDAAALHVLLLDLGESDPVNWWPPDAAPLDALRRIVEVLPAPLPSGRPYSSFVLSGVLLRTGRYDVAAHYAAQAYTAHRSPMLAVHVARAAAALGHRATALSWLRTVAETSAPMANQALREADEFAPLRDDPDFLEAVNA
jgi:Zn-dependent protease